MTKKVMKVGILPWEEYKARTLSIARGEIKPRKGDPQVWFPSMQTAAKVLSTDNIKLLRLIEEHKPKSVTELAQLTGRQQGNLSRTLKTMSKYGIVRMNKTRSHTKQPVALATGFRIEVGCEQ